MIQLGDFQRWLKDTNLWRRVGRDNWLHACVRMVMCLLKAISIRSNTSVKQTCYMLHARCKLSTQERFGQHDGVLPAITLVSNVL